MTFLVQERPSDSPLVEAVMHGYTTGFGTSIRPAEPNWHMVLTRNSMGVQMLAVGPLASAGEVIVGPGAEILWIKFKLGAFMPKMPTPALRDSQTELPGGAGRQTFWLNSRVWQHPTFDNADTFVSWLARDGALDYDPVVEAARLGQVQDVASRTVRGRFMRATGLTQGQVFQIERAKRAADMLRHGVTILDTVELAGYFDQPHLTRSLRQWIGYTPAQLYRDSAAPNPAADVTPLTEYHRDEMAEAV